MAFLPISRTDLQSRGWDCLDIILISGDAYVDHPSFAAALIARSLEAAGYRVGIISQPAWRNEQEFLVLGVHKLFFGGSAGNMDSLVNHYTAQRRLRHDDAYSPDGKAGLRPDRASLIYTNVLKRLFKGVPVVLGGVETSLRRIAHYDYWQDKIRNSILSDSKADILIYGMGEKPVLELSQRLSNGETIKNIQNLPSSVVFSSSEPGPDSIILPEAESCTDKRTFLHLTRMFNEHHDSEILYQKTANRWLKHNPPCAELSSDEMDALYELPFENKPHPMYNGKVIPAFEQIKASITSHRGCYGGCSFCSIACHQGRKVQSRSERSILKEAGKLKGTISDIGGPTANMYASRCKLDYPKSCKRQSCLFPAICPNLIFQHQKQLSMLDKVSHLPQIKHVYIASGIRHDMALHDDIYIRALATRYTGGRLKLAPEHSVPSVLRLMGKPDIGLYEEFCSKFHRFTAEAGIQRQVIPYLIIGHPGTTLEDALHLRNWLRKNRIKVEQVQEFTPTPMSISTCMYYTGLDYYTGESIHIPSPGEVRRQKELILGS